MKCEHCNNEVKKQANFCNQCGAKLKSDNNVPLTEKGTIDKDNQKLMIKLMILGSILIIGAATLIGMQYQKRKAYSKPSWEFSTSDQREEEERATEAKTEATTEAASERTTSDVAQTTEKATEKTTAASTQSTPESTSSSFVLPYSNTTYLSDTEVTELTKEELRIARNEIFARYGRKFNDKGLQQYFDNQTWYQATIEPDQFSESILNEYEKANLAKIKSVESMYD